MKTRSEIMAYLGIEPENYNQEIINEALVIEHFYAEPLKSCEYGYCLKDDLGSYVPYKRIVKEFANLVVFEEN